MHGGASRACVVLKSCNAAAPQSQALRSTTVRRTWPPRVHLYACASAAALQKTGVPGLGGGRAASGGELRAAETMMLADLCIGPLLGEIAQRQGPCDARCILLGSVFLVHLYSTLVLHPRDTYDIESPL